MKDKELKLVLKASKKVGINVRTSKNFTGVTHVVHAYNNCGDTTIFCPHIKIGDAMTLLLQTGGSIHVDNKNKECKVIVNGKTYKEKWKHNAVKEKKLCHAILNCVLLAVPSSS
jgi:hypothetical protein